MTTEANTGVLSPAGVVRRDAMLTELLGAMEHIHRRRRVRRHAGAALGVILTGAAALWATGRPGPGPGLPVAPGAARVTIRVIGDDELVSLLAEIGRPAGLIRTGGRAWLSAPVTDPELRGEKTPQG